MKKYLLLIITLVVSQFSWSKIDVVGDKIYISDDPNFEAKLEVKNFTRAPSEAQLKETGYIVANAQTSFEDERFRSRWVSLDEVILKNNQVELKSVSPAKGMAYGIIATSQDFESQIKIGQPVRIKRYGLEGDNFKGTIIRVNKKRGQDIIQVHFLASHAEELIAGTTCEVEISHIKLVPLKVSLMSLLHLGDEDYILIKEKPGVYFPKHVTILDQDSESSTVLVPVDPKLQYIARGSILLKPLLNQIVAPKKGNL